MKKLWNFSLIQQIDALIYSAGTIVFDSSDQESATRHFGEDKQLSSSRIQYNYEEEVHILGRRKKI